MEVSEFKVPNGWKLAPEEPTREMFVAANKADDKAYAGGCHHGADNEDIWHAMLAAAPAAPTADGTTSDKYRAELYDEVWQRARDMGYGNVTDALVELERMKAAAPAVQADEECAHEFVPFRSGCTKCGEPYAAPVVQAEQEPVAWDVFYSDDDCLARTARTKKEAEHYSGMAYYVKPLYYAAPPAHPDAALVEALERASKVMWSAECNLDVEAQEIERVLTAYRAALAGKGGE
jgi:hypothetical protein